MITKTYICDLCNKSVGELELLNLTSSIRIPQERYGNTLVTIDKDICKECLKKKGILVDKPDDVKKAEELKRSNTKDFQGLFTELLEEVGVMFED